MTSLNIVLFLVSFALGILFYHHVLLEDVMKKIDNKRRSEKWMKENINVKSARKNSR